MSASVRAPSKNATIWFRDCFACWNPSSFKTDSSAWTSSSVSRATSSRVVARGTISAASVSARRRFFLKSTSVPHSRFRGTPLSIREVLDLRGASEIKAQHICASSQMSFWFALVTSAKTLTS